MNTASGQSASKMPSVREGCAYFEPVLWPWPAEETTLIHEAVIDGGRLALGADESGRFLVQVAEDTSNGLKIVHNVASCIIDMEPHIILKMCISWKDAGVTFRLNGEWIAATDGSYEIPNSIKIGGHKPNPPTDFGPQNQEAVNRRNDIYRSLPTYPGKVRRPDDEIVRALRGTIRQMREAISFIDSGREDYADILVGLLRKTIADKNVPLAHLQLVAAMFGRPLIVYCEPNPPNRAAEGSSSTIGAHCWAEPTETNVNPVDLDVWLATFWGDTGSGPRTHFDVLWSMGSTVGNHFDYNMGPIEGTLRRVASSLGGKRRDGATTYLLGVANTVISLGECLCDHP